MKLEVDGTQYSNFVSAECELRLDTLASSFSFNAAAPDGEPLPFKGGEECRITVSDELVLTGHIEVIAVDYDSEEHTIIISGRSKTADLLDSSLDQFDDIRGDELSLKQLIEAVISHLGLNIKVVDEVNPPLFNGAEDIAAPEPGDNAFEFIQRYAKKRQVLLTDNANGDVVIATNSGEKAEGAVQHIIGATDNNVISANYRFDTTERFNKYKVISGLSFSALNLAGETSIEAAVNQKGIKIDTEIREGRQMIIIPDASASDANCQKRASWEADLRRARGLTYSANVDGFRVGLDTGDIWKKNKIYQIIDDFVGKIESMLCNAIVFSLSAEAGSGTALEFVGSNAYTLILEPDPLATEAANVK